MRSYYRLYFLKQHISMKRCILKKKKVYIPASLEQMSMSETETNMKYLYSRLSSVYVDS